MTVVNFDPGQQAFASNLAYGRFIDCLKLATEVLVEFRGTFADGSSATEIAIKDANGVVKSDCILEIPGNPFGLPQDSPLSFTPVGGGAAGPSSRIAAGEQADLIRAFSYGVKDSNGDFFPHFEVTGIAALSPEAFISIVTDITDGYARLVALLDDDTEITGSGASERIETGAGNDIVRSGDGDDFVFKWAPGDLSYFGGKGRDFLDLTPDRTADVAPFTQGMTLDLSKGTGETAYGGKLILKSVEVIQTGNSDDTILGSKRADEVESTGGSDTFRLKGGNDRVEVATGLGETTYDGGRGHDHLSVTTAGSGGYDPVKGFGIQRLDLRDSSRNKEDFATLSLKNVEDVEINMVRDFINLTVIGTGASETLTVNNFFARSGANTIRANGGNDTVLGGYGVDRIIGGNGRDTIRGRDGDDVIKGGRGADIINGGLGDDVMSGNARADVFVFEAGVAGGFGEDRITDFKPGKDRLDFTAVQGVAGLSDLGLDEDADGVTISAAQGGTLLLQGLRLGDIDAGDFLFSV
jgi:Ca2+-binding RTX toxin-like protein